MPTTPNILPALRGTLAALGPWQSLFARSNFRLYPYTPGAVSTGNSGTTINLEGKVGNQNFAVNDYILVCAKTSYGGSFLYVPDMVKLAQVATVSASALTVTAAVTVSDGDYIFNLGSDGGVSPLIQPGYTDVIASFTSPHGGTANSNNYVTTGSGGFFSAWLAAGTKVCDLLITDSSNTPQAVWPVFELSRPSLDGVYNVKDYGAVGDGATNDSAAIASAIAAVPTSGGTVLFPSGDYYLQSSTLIDRGNITIRGEQNARLVVDGNAVFCLKFRGLQAPGGRMANVKVENMMFYDPDPTNHVGAGPEESHGIQLQAVDHAVIAHCHFDSLGDEAIDTGQSKHVHIHNNYAYNCCAASTVTNAVTGCFSLNSCSWSRIESNHIKENNFGTAIRVETGVVPPPTVPSSNNVIADNIIEDPKDTRGLWLTSGWNAMGVGIGVIMGVNADSENIIITGNIVRNPLRAGIQANATGTAGGSPGAVRRLTITDNQIVGGGDARWWDHLTEGNGPETGAINVRGVSNDGIIANNIIEDWANGLSGTGGYSGTHWGIYVNRDRFVIEGNLISNCAGGIHTNAAAGYEQGNIIQGNRLYGLYKIAASVVGIRGTGRDLIQGNSLDSLSCDAGQNLYGIDTAASNDGSVKASCIVIGNYVRDPGANGTKRLLRLQHRSVGAFNRLDGASQGCTGLVINGDQASNLVPVSYGNLIENCSTNTSYGATTGDKVRVFHPFGDGVQGTEHVTDGAAVATLSGGSTSVPVTHNVKDLVRADVQITPLSDWGNMTKFWVTAVGTSTFTIQADLAPGSDVDFAWSVVKRARITVP